MTKYQVHINEVRQYIVEVEAEDEDAAQAKAWEKMDSDGREKYFHGEEEGDVTAFEVK